jgi:hypothetical protein
MYLKLANTYLVAAGVIFVLVHCSKNDEIPTEYGTFVEKQQIELPMYGTSVICCIDLKIETQC